MQQNLEEMDEEQKNMKKKLSEREEERDRATEDLKEMQKFHQDTIDSLSEAFSGKKFAEINEELNSVKESLSHANQELKMKEKNSENLTLELEKAKMFESKFKEQNASLRKLKEELNSAKNSELLMVDSLSETKKRIKELEMEIGKRKESDTRMYDSLVMQTKQFEQTKILLEESKLEIASLQKKLEKMEGSSPNQELEILKSEIELANSNLIRAREGEKSATMKVQGLMEEINMLKTQLKYAAETEENTNKALDDLALALKEVATEASQVKEKLYITQGELEYVKKDAENSKLLLKNTEEKFKQLLEESRKESERYQNTAKRLILEAEESLLAWNGKETGFVNCIKIAEDEKIAAQEENSKLLELLKVTENMHKVSREENTKLRDIMKQALNESNVAKEAAGIARAENSQLKDTIAEKDEALNFLTREYDHLRMNEAAAMENIKEFKRMIAETPVKEQPQKLKTHNSMEIKTKDSNKLMNTMSLQQNGDEFEEADLLRGSIFDKDIVDSPLSATHMRKQSGAGFGFGENGEMKKSAEEFEHMDMNRFEEMENDRSSGKKKALLRRFGDLIIRRRSFHRRDISE